jgi:hypothetical protein
MLRAERDLARARLSAAAEPATAPAATAPTTAPAAFTAAIASLRERGTPYHLAHGLLDHAQYLLAQRDADAAALAIEEARDIGDRLRCQPLLDRASSDSLRLTRANSPTSA